MPAHIPTEAGPHRDALGFSKAVLKSFNFFEDYGLRASEVNATLVRFTSPRRCAYVFHGRASYEIGVEIGRLVELDGHADWDLYSLRDIIRLGVDPADFGYRGTTATTIESIVRVVGELSSLTQKFGTPLLKNGEAQFLQMRDVRSLATQRLVDDQRASLLRSRAGVGWARGDWSSVVDAYSEIDLELSTQELKESERGRLGYAIRKLSDQDDGKGNGSHS